MGELAESFYLTTLRPVLTIIGGHRILESVLKLIVTNSFDQRMDYESVEASHTFEARRDAKMFDKYVNQGILKLSWTTKCRKFVPACILLIFDWSGGGIDSPILESPDWKHKESTILKYLRKFKDQCKGRIVKIGILCLLGSTNEELSLEEKLSQLKKNGEIDGKGIVLLKHKIEEGENIPKLKKFLWDGCISHYKDEIERLKKLKSRAHKEISGNPIELQIRYNFKLGYYNELKQDKDTALNFYKKCYKEIQDPSIEQTVTVDERRTVADLVSHRIQCLLLSAPHLLVKLKEAISTFKSHVSSYKIPKNKSSNVFENYKWLSEHFSRFASLLERVPNEIYEKDNFWTHPGFYFQVSGIYYMMRLKLTVEDPEFLQSVQNWQGFIASAGLRIKDPVYIGQNKTLASHPLQKDMIEGISIADQVNIIKILEEAEVKHLPIALDYLFRSLKFYRGIVPMPKMGLFLSQMLANLYKKKGEYDTNYQYKCDIVNKMEGWNSVQEDLLEDLIIGAENSQKVTDLLQWTLKALEIKKNSPVSLFEKLNSTLTSNLAQIQAKGLIFVKAKFDSKIIAAYSSVNLTLTLTSGLPCALTPVKLSLLFSEPSFNCDNAGTVTLEPGVPIKIVHSLIIRNPNMPPLSLIRIVARYEPVNLSWIDFEIEAKAKLQIISPPPQLSPTFNHLPPALIGENYILNIKLHPYTQLSALKMVIYEESKEIGQRRRAASIDRNFDNNYCIFSEDGMTLEDGISLSELLTPQTIPLKLIFYEEKSYMLKAKFSYTVHKLPDITYKWEDIYDLDITVQPPFQIKLKWSNIIESQSTAVLNAKICNICSTSIYLYKVSLIPDSDWESHSVKTYEALEVFEGNIISEDFVAKIINNESSCNLTGNLLVTWSRKEGVINDCRLPLPLYTTQCFPIDLIVNVGSEYFLGQVFEMTLVVKNKTKLELEARLILDEASYFLIGGVENIKFELKEEGEKTFKFSLVGVETGLQDLPKINVKLTEVTKSWQGKVLVLP